MKLSVSFSGGSTSAYMSYLLKRDFDAGNLPEYDEIQFLYANTGQEHPLTLEFIDRCDREWGLNVVWLEAVINPEKGKGTGYRVVDYETACRDGRLFEDFCAKYGLPTMVNLYCTRELKTVPMDKYRGKDSVAAIGIRVDEIDRISANYKKNGWTYPLVFRYGIRKVDVYAWFEKQPFRLEIPQWLGNCTWCYKKSDEKLKKVMTDDLRHFDVPRMLEDKYRFAGARGEHQQGEARKIFRHKRSTSDLIEQLSATDRPDTKDGGCSGTCEPFQESMNFGIDTWL